MFLDGGWVWKEQSYGRLPSVFTVDIGAAQEREPDSPLVSLNTA